MKLILFWGAALLIMSGCSGGDDAEEPVKAQTEAEASGEAGDEAKLAEADKAKDGGTSEESDEEEVSAEVEEVEPAPVGAMPLPTEPAGFTGPKIWKYVTSFALKVRSEPNKEASNVVRYVKKGDKIEVVIDGEWAKIGNGEYVSANRLSNNDPAIKPGKARKNKSAKGKNKK